MFTIYELSRKVNVCLCSITIKCYIYRMETNETHEKVRAYVERHYKSFYNESLIVEEAMSVFYVYNHPDGSPMVFSRGILNKV